MLNTSDLDDVLLIRTVKIDAEGKLDEASLRLAAQLPISHERLDTIEDELGGSSLIRQHPTYSQAHGRSSVRVSNVQVYCRETTQ